MYNCLINEGFERINTYWKYDEDWYDTTEEAYQWMNEVLLKDEVLKYE